MSQYDSQAKGAKDKDSGLDLSVGQVLAATGATTIGAVLVKLLDIWGTVLGTAVLSVCTSIGAVLILRTMRHTGDKIKSQISALSPRAAAGQTATVALGEDRVTATAPIPGPEELARLDQTAVAHRVGAEAEVEPLGDGQYEARPGSRRRTLLTIVVSSVLVFALTIAALFVIGLFTGEPGRFVHQQQPDPATTVITEETEPADDDAPAEAPTTELETDPTGEGPNDADTGSASPEPDETDEPTPAPTDDEDAGETGTGEESAPGPEEEALTTAPEDG